MKLVFLGTSGMVPTKDRNVQSLYLDYNGEGILLDCGEGTQRQITLAGLSAQKIRKILISHWHGDHVAGLLGLIQTLGNFGNEDVTVHLYGPTGTQGFLDHMMQSCVFDMTLNLEVHELDPQGLETFYEHDDYYLQCAPLEHSIPTLGFRFVKKERRKFDKQKLRELGLEEGPLLGELQKGKSIEHNSTTITPEEVTELIGEKSLAFIFDTQLTDNCYELAKNSEVLVSEAVYTSDLEHKAEQYKHLTAKQVAHIAAQCGVHQLILTHFSQRYKTTAELEEDAKQLFDNVVCAYDLMKVEFDF